MVIYIVSLHVKSYSIKFAQTFIHILFSYSLRIYLAVSARLATCTQCVPIFLISFSFAWAWPRYSRSWHPRTELFRERLREHSWTTPRSFPTFSSVSKRLSWLFLSLFLSLFPSESLAEYKNVLKISHKTTVFTEKLCLKWNHFKTHYFHEFVSS